MDTKDIRWVQRFSNFKKALAKLAEVAILDTDALSELEKEGMIQRALNTPLNWHGKRCKTYWKLKDTRI